MPHPSLPLTLTTAAAIAAAGTLSVATLSASSQLFGQTLIANRDPNLLALTYDDGPNPAVTPQLLELLARHHIRATFFMIGNFVRQCPALVREIAAAGHLIGNHTLTHPWLPFVSNARILHELTATNALLEDTLGQPIHFLRCPHGARRPFVLHAARSLQLTPVQWNVIAYDWRPDPPATILHHITRGIARNTRRRHASNILLHDGGHTALNQPRLPSVEATRLLLEHHRPHAAQFVTVDAFL